MSEMDVVVWLMFSEDFCSLLEVFKGSSFKSRRFLLGMLKVRLRVHRQERRGRIYTWYELTLPKDVVELLGWGEDTELEVRLYTSEDGRQGILLLPVKK